MTTISVISGRFNHTAARVVKLPSFADEIGTANSSDNIIYATRGNRRRQEPLANVSANARSQSSRASAYRVHRTNFAVVLDRLMYDTRSPRTFITITNMVFH